MSSITRQEILDKVASHIILQGGPAYIAPAYSTPGGCFYRMSSGRKCAFGIFIPDEGYHGSLEGFGASRILHICSQIKAADLPAEGERHEGILVTAALVTGVSHLTEHASFISALQLAHDDAARHREGFGQIFAARIAALATSQDLVFDKDDFLTKFVFRSVSTEGGRA